MPLQQFKLGQKVLQTSIIEVEPIDEVATKDWKMLTQLLNEVQLVNPEALKMVDSMIEADEIKKGHTTFGAAVQKKRGFDDLTISSL